MTGAGRLAWLLGVVVVGCGSSDVAPTPSGPASTCDGLTKKQCDALGEIALPDTLPAALGNDHAEDFNAAAFGFHFFFDSRFSKNQNVRCESCHSVDFAFADNAPTPTEGLGTGARNSPTIFNAARYTTFFWDGRADTLWSQPLFAIENPKEMGFTRLEIVHLLGSLYAKEYASVFGALPDFSDAARFPAQGAPGDAAWGAMSPDDQTAVNRTVSNVGKALEAYMRKVATGPSPADQYLSGKKDALSDVQRRGMTVFARSGCLDCHSGPQLSDNEFHNLGVPVAEGQEPDPGRAAAISILDDNPFNASGPFFDGTPPAPADETPVLGGFRTPSLRNLPKSSPYGHNGIFATLEDVVDFHLQGGGNDTSTFVGDVDPLLEPQKLSDDDKNALVEFLKALSGSYPPLPWGQWPNGNG